MKTYSLAKFSQLVDSGKLSMDDVKKYGYAIVMPKSRNPFDKPMPLVVIAESDEELAELIAS